MVKKIAKTYSVENGQVKKAVTFLTEEPLSSKSSAFYNSNAPSEGQMLVHLHNTWPGQSRGVLEDGSGNKWGIAQLDLTRPPAPYSSNTPAKYDFADFWHVVSGQADDEWEEQAVFESLHHSPVRYNYEYDEYDPWDFIEHPLTRN